MSVKRWAVVDGGFVVGAVKWDGVTDWQPAVGTAVDPGDAPFGIGWAYDGSAFIAPDPDSVSWDDIRAERDGLLAASDWTQVADAPVDAAAWAVYRQALRDVPQDYDSPDDIVWPEAP